MSGRTPTSGKICPSTTAIMSASRITSPVMALCGKVWVPSRDPKKFPVCPDCQRIYESRPESGDS
jgi:hypothetical protein